MTEVRTFFAALRFFTRIPLPARLSDWVGHSADQIARAPCYLPLIGALVGAVGSLVTETTAMVLPPSIAIVLGMAATLFVTGAFHEDGLADSADGFGGGWDKAQVLAIMKDSRIGSYGVIAVVMALLLKFVALLEFDALLEHDAAPPLGLAFLLIAAHATSRLAPVVLMNALDYVRDDEASKSKPLTGRLGTGSLLFAAICALSPLLLLPAITIGVALGFAALTSAACAYYFQRRIGGYTGDCLGAAQQLAELAFYLGALCAFS